MHISKADREDLIVILEMQKEAYQAEAKIYNDFSIPPLTESLENITQAFHSEVILKGESDGQIVGAVRAKLQGNTCLIGRLCVNPAFQKQGTGSALLQACESVFSDAEYCELFTGSKSTANLRLYKRLGYKPTKEEVLSPQVTLVYLRKKLASEKMEHG